MKRCVCNNVQRRAYASRPIVWKADMIFKVNINNDTNGCALIISSPIAKQKPSKTIELYHGIALDNHSKMVSHYFT
jgi:hypothetical protein